MHPSSDLFFPFGVRRRPLSHTTSWWGFSPPASSLSSSVTLEFKSRGLAVAAMSRRDRGGLCTVSPCAGLTARALLVYTEPIIIAAVARPSSDIKRLFNQHQLYWLWCTARQCPYHTALFSPEYRIISPALRRNRKKLSCLIPADWDFFSLFQCSCWQKVLFKCNTKS